MPKDKDPKAAGAVISPDDKVAIWNHWAKTPQEHTREVKQGVSHPFTCVNAYYQFKKATELFGPCGVGWGWDAPTFERMFSEDRKSELIVFRTRLWIGSPDTPGIPLINSDKLWFKDGQKIDDEIMKKILTDTITKGLSYLGCAADVFQGYYDDNRYVEKLRREEADGKPETKRDVPPAPPSSQPDGKAPANPPAPQEAKQPTEHGKLYAAICAEIAKVGCTSEELKAHLKGHGYQTLNACPTHYLKNLLTKCTNRAAAYAHAVKMGGADGREAVAKWLEGNNLDMFHVEPAQLLALAEDLRQVRR